MDYSARLVAATVRKTPGRSAHIVRWSAAMCEMERNDQLTVAGSLSADSADASFSHGEPTANLEARSTLTGISPSRVGK